MKTNRHVIIIGAGMAGLMAAIKLLENGYAVTIFEARSRIGGRVHTIRKDPDLIIEAGAEFIHGRPPLTLNLLKKFDISYHKTGGKMITISDGIPGKEDEQVKGWDELMEKMAGVETDLIFSDFLNQYFGDDAYAGLRSSALRFAAGFDLVDPDLASTKHLYKEWSEEEEVQFRISKGYIELAEALAASCIKMNGGLNLNAVVSEIQWEQKRVTTTDGKIYHADKIIVTIPISLLDDRIMRKGLINFAPHLPSISSAVAQIGFGTVIKVLLQFNNDFWNDSADQAGFFFIQGIVPTWWTQAPDKSMVLTGWLGGLPATPWKGKPDSEILEQALQSLHSGFNLSMDELKDSLVNSYIFNWQDEDFSYGAYSYALPETDLALTTLKASINNTVYFAGEAIYEGKYPGTVEAALVSGVEAAGRVMNDEL